MRTLAEFTKTTLIGGVLIILPVYLAALLLAKTVKCMLELLSPVAAQIPIAVEFRQILAIALLVAVCFIVGLIVRTGPGLREGCLRAVGAGKASRLHVPPRVGRSIDRPLAGAHAAAGAGKRSRR